MAVRPQALLGRGPARVVTDGSCMTLAEREESGPVGFGGWAAVCERGSEGWTAVGCEESTTAVRMELRAAIEGLRTLPPALPVELVFDCTVILAVAYRRQRGRPMVGRDGDLWRLLAAELDLRPTTLRLLEKRERDDRHRRAHAMAGAQARALRLARRAA